MIPMFSQRGHGSVKSGVIAAISMPFLILALAAALALAAPAMAQGKGTGKGLGGATGIVGTGGGLPPGLAKKNPLPHGLAKRGGNLPPGLAKRGGNLPPGLRGR